MIGAGIAIILLATLGPGSGRGSPAARFSFCLACGPFGGTDFIANIVLFLPLGLALGWRSSHRWRWLLAAFALSAVVELSQALWLPTRSATLGDLAANTAGAAIGVVWAQVRHRRLAAQVLGLLATALTIAIAAAGSFLLQPAPLATSGVFGQIAHRFGGTVRYPGTVLAFRAADHLVDDGPIPDARPISDAWAAHGLELEVVTVATTNPNRRSQIAGLADGAIPFPAGFWHTNTRVGFELRWRAHHFRLRGPGLAIAAPTPGDTVQLKAAWRDGILTLSTEGGRAAALRAGPGTAWTLLAPLPIHLKPGMRYLGIPWLAILFGLPAFLLGVGGLPPRPAWLGLGGTLGAALFFLPLWAGVPPATLLESLAAAAGTVAGWWGGWSWACDRRITIPSSRR